MTDLVLITGGLGYVGGRVAQALAHQNDWRLRIVTRRSPDNPPSWLKGLETVTLDLLAANDLTSICQGVRYVVHLAAPDEIESAANAQHALLVTGLGTLRLLEAAERTGVERFIYFSTAHVYGAPLVGTITEQSLPRPIHPYAITHKLAEDFVLAARDQGKIEGIVLRLSNGFGVPALTQVDRWTLVVNDLCRQVISGGRLVLRSPGLQWRDFITLTDVARAVGYFLNLADDTCADGLFNLGGDFSLRIIDMAQRIAHRSQEILGFTPPIHRPKPSPVDDQQPLFYKVDKLKATGFTWQMNFDEEIDATLHFCQDVFGKP